MAAKDHTNRKVNHAWIPQVVKLDEMCESKCYLITRNDDYIFKDENGNVINATKIVLEKKKKEYPKTYEECCKVLRLNTFNQTVVGYKYKLITKFQQLLICRDAYWKIAGNEMGLEKPWEPDYNDLNSTTYGLYDELKYSIINPAQFVFPSKEMRDAFKENFDPDIEICKELL